MTKPLNMPCLEPQGLEVLPVTAHQRYFLGEELFLSTHFPVQARRFQQGRSSQTISEDEILEWILARRDHHPGNRVFILYGAAGSGKSELMAWLELMLQKQSTSNEAHVIRISRTDLDIFSVVEKFKFWLTGEYFADLTHQRWNEMRRKTRTFTKLLVLKSLEAMVDSDELINALYYRLVDVVEPHIIRIFGDEEQPRSHQTEILLREDFEQIRDETALEMSEIDFERFRYLMIEGLREHLFEGLRLKDTLQQISQALSQQSIRPILLIDDLVQSINIFADELLDYFITLEEGNWDVVIGLTPASFDTDGRARELLNRITYLDTIDDRVTKLWLSDEQGEKSFFLNEDNCHIFAYRYLKALRLQNQVSCNTCPSFYRCQALSRDNEVILAPFNRELLTRIFRSVPNGKGKVRHYLLALRNILELIIQGVAPDEAISQFTNTDIYVETENETTQKILTWYGPLASQLDLDHIDTGLLDFFELPSELPTAIHSLATRRELSIELKEETQAEIDPARSAIRTWLVGDTPNRQLLDRLRRGTAKWLKSIYPTEYFHKLNTAKPSRVLRFKQVELGTSPTFGFEGLASDKEIQILINRDIGQAALWLEHFATATGDDSHKLAIQLSSDPRMLNILWRGQIYHNQSLERFEHQLGITLEEFAYHLYVLLCLVNGATVRKRPPGFLDSFWLDLQVQGGLIRSRSYGIKIPEAHAETIEMFFTDMFRLRQNLYNGAQLNELSRGHSPQDSLIRLAAIEMNLIGIEYYLKGAPFHVFWEPIMSTVSLSLRALTEPETEELEEVSSETRHAVARLRSLEPIYISQVLTNVLKEIELYAPDIYRRLAVILTTD